MSGYIQRTFVESSGQQVRKMARKPKDGVPSEASRLKQYASLSSYVRDTLKTSLITSVPEITATRSWLLKGVKIVVFCLCLVGFVYQTMDFLSLYLSYPTVVNVLISNPIMVPRPAITICNKNRITRRYACSKYPGKCSNFSEDLPPKERKLDFCKEHPMYCPQMNGELDFRLPKDFNLSRDFWSWDDARNGGHDRRLIGECLVITAGNQTVCGKYRIVPVFTDLGEPTICHVIDSLWGNPDVEPESNYNTFTIRIHIYTFPDEYLVTTESPSVVIAVHDRRRLVNPYEEGVVIRGGISYVADVSMIEYELLPYPYDTNCTDYLKAWKKNNGTGPLNNIQCIEKCKLDSLIRQGKCIDKDVTYPNEEKICPLGVETTSTELTQECSRRCGKSCWDQQYEVDYFEVATFQHTCILEHCKFHSVRVKFNFKKFRITKFQYQPKFESVEMFSYIGGYMGMWLGLSLVSMFDFSQTILSLAYFPIGRFKWQQLRAKGSTNGKSEDSKHYRSQMR